MGWQSTSLLDVLNIFFLELSAKATDEYEFARRKVATFINASESREIVFTKNATEAINLVAYSWGLSNLKPDDEVSLYHSIWYIDLHYLQLFIISSQLEIKFECI